MWEIHSSDQAVTFLWSIVLGVLLCLFYDIFRAKRAATENGVIAVALQDIFFWSVSAIVTFLFLLARTNGQLRFFVFAGMVIGFFVCRFSISRLWILPFVYFFRGINFLKEKFYAVYIVILTRLTAFFGYFFTLCVEIFKNILKLRKKLLKKRGGVLYTEHINESKDM